MKLSWKEEYKYHILKCIYGIQKNGTNEPICRATVEDTDIENKLVDVVKEGEDAAN